jgi:DNA invertase Pin-like site-specific DNA recombinase
MKLYQKNQTRWNILNNEKYHVFFRRVSTAGQDLSMQASADALYRERLLPEEIKIINEDATSANKKSIDDRPEMQKVISFIKQDKVHTLYAFDRTRLFRDHYEGMQFTDLCLKHNVRIVYTSQGNGSIQATEDIFLEGILSMFSDIEGKNIARRTEEARRRYPPKKLGYEKIKETKQYRKDPQKQEPVLHYFSSLLEITTIDDLGELFREYRKKFKCDDDRLIGIAQDPFYASYDLSKGVNKLSHVEPYIDLETFNRIQETIQEIVESYLERTKQLVTQNAYTPHCGFCRKPLHYRIDEINNTGFYTCSRKHAKLSITFFDLAKVVQLVLHEVITNLDSKKLLNHSMLRLREIRNNIEADVKTIEYQLNEIMEKIILNTGDYSSDWKDELQYKKMTRLKNEKCILLEELTEKECLLQENKKIVEAVESYLHNRLEINPSLLYKMFINKIYVYKNEIDIEVSMFDYLKELQTDFIYTGDEIA